MAARRILFDKSELVLVQQGEGGTLNLTYDQITRIELDTYEAFRLFKRVPIECIKIYVKRREEPIVYKKAKEKAFFDEYKEGLIEFAANNRIPLNNKLSA